MNRKEKHKYLLLICISIISVVSLTASPRMKRTINEKWAFHKGDIKGAEAIDFDNSKWENIVLPHTWNIEDVEDEPYGWYRGVGWYRREVPISNIEENRRLFITFEGANQVSEVWFNGQKLGTHIGGYTPFTFEITGLAKEGQKNILAVKMDNSHNEDIAPLSADFTFYGGIYRDVYFISTDNVHFDMKDPSCGVFIHSYNITNNRATIGVRSIFNLSGNKNLSIEHIIVDADGKTVNSYTRKLKNTNESICEIEVKNPILWDTETPYLYKIISRLKDNKGNILDEVHNPLGIRWFNLDPDRGFFLNGKHVKLIGTNRHQDYLHHGNALTDDMHRFDLKLMKEMGANCLRISHYPHDPAVLEMCDQYGFICFEELPIINRINTTKEFYDNSISQIREMILRDYNHPSIIAWNMSNEINVHYPSGDMTEEQREEYRVKLAEYLANLNTFIKETDPYRASMIVHCFEPKDNVRLNYHVADFIGYNKYMGWYEQKFENIYTFFNDFKKADPNRPLFLSEYGAGSDTRLHTFNPTRYDHSEEYQLKFLKAHLKALLETDFVAGGTVWNFNDFNSEYRGDAIPHINEKGLVTADRKLKISYYYYKTILNQTPSVCIPSKLWKVRGGREDFNGAKISSQDVEVFANVDKVELFLNGKSLSAKDVIEFSTIFKVPFVHGKNLLELRGVDAKGKKLQDFLEIDFTLQPYDLKSNTHKFSEIAINCGSYCYFNDDFKNNYLWSPDQAYQAGSWGYTGGKFYMRGDIVGAGNNVMNTNIDPVFQTQLRGLESYRFDVADGDYEITLLFAELETNKDNIRVFDVGINGTTLLSDLDIKKQYGTNQAVVVRFATTATNGDGVTVNLTPKEGETILNGIICRKIY